VKNYVLTASAARDLSRIAAYIAKDNPAAAKKTIGKMMSVIRLLARMPGIGHSREDLAEETLRFFGVDAYLVIYRPAKRPLEIVRILHAARDVNAVLRDL
jgi:plasmid stabilization system protein ParE